MKLAHRVALALSALGVLDVILRIYYLGFEAGLTAVVNDPGKEFFHILLLPALAYLLLTVPLTSRDLLRGLFRLPMGRFIVGALLVVAMLQSANEAKSAFTRTNSSPEDFADPKNREDYAQARKDLLFLRTGGAHENSVRAKAIVQRYNIYSVVTETNDLIEITGDQARDAAYSISHKLVGDDADWPACLRKASLRRYVATLLAFAGNLAMAWLFFAVCFSSLPQSRPATKERDVMLLMIAIFSMWLPLKFYSEWYYQFYPDSITYGPLKLGAFIAIVAAVVVYSRSSKSMFNSIAPGAVTLASAASALIFQNKVEFFSPLATTYRDAGWVGILVIHVVIIMALASIASHVHRNLMKKPAVPAGDS